MGLCPHAAFDFAALAHPAARGVDRRGAGALEAPTPRERPKLQLSNNAQALPKLTPPTPAPTVVPGFEEALGGLRRGEPGAATVARMAQAYPTGQLRSRVAGQYGDG